jgi:hypothetical protein
MTASTNFIADLFRLKKKQILSPVQFHLYIHVGLLSRCVYGITGSVYLLLVTDAVSAMDSCKIRNNAAKL